MTAAASLLLLSPGVVAQGSKCATNSKRRSNALSTWIKTMMGWKEKDETAKGKGDLALSVRALLAGEDWVPGGPYGLTGSERLVLKGFVLEDVGLGSDAKERERVWRDHVTAERIVWGQEANA